jgi:hypothetical protein
LENLVAKVEAFSRDSHTLLIQDEAEMDQVRYRIELKQPHVSIFLILGDALQCLRTALDQAVWSLIHHRTGLDPENSEFPIFAKPPDSERRKKLFKDKIEGLSDEAIAYIESIQPYNRPTGTPPGSNLLWCLHQLNRIDKHRRISVRAQVALANRNHVGVGMPDSMSMRIENRTNDGCDIVCGGMYKNIKPTVTSIVQFGELESGIVMTIEGVRMIHDFVTDTVLVSLAGFAQRTTGEGNANGQD